MNLLTLLYQIQAISSITIFSCQRTFWCHSDTFDTHIILINSDNDVVDGWYTFRDGKKTYIDSDLNPARGIIRIDGVLYGFHPVIGLLVTGWNEINGTWYLMDDNGKVQTGWQKWKGKWYLLGEDGAMKTRWQLVDGKWYFMRDNGMMLRSEYIQGYWLNKDGSCTYKPVAEWKEDSVGLYYQDTSGYYVRNTKVFIDRNWYLFDKRGYVIDFEVAPEGDFRFDY